MVVEHAADVVNALNKSKSPISQAVKCLNIPTKDWKCFRMCYETHSEVLEIPKELSYEDYAWYDNTYPTVTRQLEELMKKVQPNDTVFLVFKTHGNEEGQMQVGPTLKESGEIETRMRKEELVDFIGKLRGKTLGFVDACYSAKNLHLDKSDTVQKAVLTTTDADHCGFCYTGTGPCTILKDIIKGHPSISVEEMHDRFKTGMNDLRLKAERKDNEKEEPQNPTIQFVGFDQPEDI